MKLREVKAINEELIEYEEIRLYRDPLPVYEHQLDRLTPIVIEHIHTKTGLNLHERCGDVSITKKYHGGGVIEATLVLEDVDLTQEQLSKIRKIVNDLNLSDTITGRYYDAVEKLIKELQ